MSKFKNAFTIENKSVIKFCTEKDKLTQEKLEEQLVNSNQIIKNHELTIDYLQKCCSDHENKQKENILHQQKQKDKEVLFIILISSKIFLNNFS